MYMKIQIYTSPTEEWKYVKYKCIVQYKFNSNQTEVKLEQQLNFRSNRGLTQVRQCCIVW